MAGERFTHVSIHADDVEESAAFYTDVIGLEPIPTPNYGDPIQWFRVGDAHLHVVEKDVEAPTFHHIALHVDDLERVYRGVTVHETATFGCLGDPAEEFVDGEPPVYSVASGAVQLYVHDPAGNKVEINVPDADALDRSVFTNVVDREEVAPPPDDRGAVTLYTDELRAAVGTDTL